MFEAAVDGFGGAVTGVGVVEVGQDVCGSAFECPAQGGELGEGGGCQVLGFVEACLGRFLSCCCVFVFCLLWCDSAQGEVRAACVVPVDPV